MSVSERRREARRLVIDSLAELEPWLARWDALAVAAARPCCAPGWMLPWWEHLRPACADLRVVLLADGERLLGFAPFYLHRGRAGRRDARILAAAHSHRVDILAEPAQAGALGAEAAAALAALRPSLVGFENFDSESPWPAAVRAAWPGRRRPSPLAAPPLPTPIVTLDPAGHAAWLAGRSRRFRRTAELAGERLAEQGGRVELASGPAARTAAIAAFERLHQARWAGRGGSLLPPAATSAMLRGASARLPGDDRLRLWTVRIGGEIAAVEIYVAAGGEVAAWNGGWDERHARLQLPLLAQLAAIEDAAERGDRRIDLGGGLQHHKLRFADPAVSAAVASPVLLAPGPRGLLTRAELLPGQARRALRRAAQRLPEDRHRAIRDAVRRVRGRRARA